ncbi:MAG: lytic murein transglycosylase B [Gammaproteobacteria bacterium]|nr:lytic murein transglycosylase B [Gammaproteobacteria bacterium]
MSVDSSEYPRLEEFISSMEQKHKFSATELRGWFAETEIRTDIIEIMQRPREAAPWHEYREQFVTGPSASRGYRFWKKNKKAFERAEKKYGVPPEYILAILGVETQYGLNKGRFRIMDALTTLAMEHPSRHEFFQRELEQFLVLARELKRDPLEFTGSYAGAMGLPQFLPSSYRQYAVDFNKDHHLDLLTDNSDAIGSVANYLKIHGWKRNEQVIADAEINGNLHPWFETLSIKPTMQLSHFVDYGIFPKKSLDAHMPATLLKLEASDGPLYRFGFNNFYVITRYNKSVNYAMAVTELAQLIREKMDNIN